MMAVMMMMLMNNMRIMLVMKLIDDNNGSNDDMLWQLRKLFKSSSTQITEPSIYLKFDINCVPFKLTINQIIHSKTIFLIC